ncbi:MAG: hypothetical protein IPK16_32210 [Anaerolineales bacterium]|nr:hypothetical protein [Anaerolineales bacterium]
MDQFNYTITDVNEGASTGAVAVVVSPKSNPDETLQVAVADPSTDPTAQFTVLLPPLRAGPAAGLLTPARSRRRTCFFFELHADRDADREYAESTGQLEVWQSGNSIWGRNLNDQQLENYQFAVPLSR